MESITLIGPDLAPKKGQFWASLTAANRAGPSSEGQGGATLGASVSYPVRSLPGIAIRWGKLLHLWFGRGAGAEAGRGK